jgi:hypothetical protein
MSTDNVMDVAQDTQDLGEDLNQDTMEVVEQVDTKQVESKQLETKDDSKLTLDDSPVEEPLFYFKSRRPALDADGNPLKEENGELMYVEVEPLHKVPVSYLWLCGTFKQACQNSANDAYENYTKESEPYLINEYVKVEDDRTKAPVDGKCETKCVKYNTPNCVQVVADYLNYWGSQSDEKCSYIKPEGSPVTSGVLSTVLKDKFDHDLLLNYFKAEVAKSPLPCIDPETFFAKEVEELIKPPQEDNSQILYVKRYNSINLFLPLLYTAEEYLSITSLASKIYSFIGVVMWHMSLEEFSAATNDPFYFQIQKDALAEHDKRHEKDIALINEARKAAGGITDFCDLPEPEEPKIPDDPEEPIEPLSPNNPIPPDFVEQTNTNNQDDEKADDDVDEVADE